MFNRCWRSLSRAIAPPHSVRKAGRSKICPKLEHLEDRIVPATWDVNLTSDTGTGNLTNHTGDLRFCVANAAAGDTIEFDSSLNNQTIYLNSAIQISQDGLNILGETPDGELLNVTIDGQANTRLFEILGSANLNGVTMDYLTLTGGHTSGNGGAVLVDPNAVFSPYADTFTNDTAGGNGGAIENDGNTTVSTCAFSNDTAGGNGGAIENTSQLTVQTPTSTPGYPTISNFVSDGAVGMGGAIDSSDGGQGQVNISNANFYSNTAANGGAVSTADPTTLDTDTFGGAGEGNSATASGGNGGAVYALQNPNAQNQTQLYASNSMFDSDQAGVSGSGGGIYTTMNMEADNDTVTNDSAGLDGGGILCAAVPPGSLVLTGNETVDGGTYGKDVAGRNGGGICLTGGGKGSLNASNATFINGKAALGGAIYTDSSTTLTNDTFGTDKNNTNTATGNGGAIYANLVPVAGVNPTLNVSYCTLAFTDSSKSKDTLIW